MVYFCMGKALWGKKIIALKKKTGIAKTNSRHHYDTVNIYIGLAYLNNGCSGYRLSKLVYRRDVLALPKVMTQNNVT